MAQLESHSRSNHDRHIAFGLSSGVVLIGLLAFAALSFRFFSYTLDDSYISFRYASNLAAGQGLVFNPGEQPRSEGITSPLYAALLALAPLTGIDIVTFAKWLGLLACLLTASLIGTIIYRLTRSLTSLAPMSAMMISASGAAWLMSNPYVVGNALSGMETALSALAFGAFLFLVVRLLTMGTRPGSKDVICLGVVATLVPMFRPEMGLSVVITLAVAIMLGGEARLTLLSSLALFLVVGSAYFCLRFLYYGLPLPLPFYIKQDSFGLHGLSDVKSYLKHVLLLLPLVYVCFAFAIGPHYAQRKRSCVCLIAILAAVGAELIYYGSLRHIMGFGFRYFVPITVGLVSLAFVGAAILYDIAARSKLSDAFSFPSIFGAVVILLLYANARAYRPAHDTFVEWYATGMQRNVQIARTMTTASQGTVFRIAINDCGAIPFYTGFPTVDLAGLNNRAIALARTTEAARNEIAEKRPHLVVLVSKQEHDPSALFGWERLTHDDVTTLGYEYVGTMTAGTMPDGVGYHLLVYAKSDMMELVRPFLDRLLRSGILIIPPVGCHSGNLEPPYEQGAEGDAIIRAP